MPKRGSELVRDELVVRAGAPDRPPRRDLPKPTRHPRLNPRSAPRSSDAEFMAQPQHFHPHQFFKSFAHAILQIRCFCVPVLDSVAPKVWILNQHPASRAPILPVSKIPSAARIAIARPSYEKDLARRNWRP